MIDNAHVRQAFISARCRLRDEYTLKLNKNDPTAIATYKATHALSDIASRGVYPQMNIQVDELPSTVEIGRMVTYLNCLGFKVTDKGRFIALETLHGG